MLVMCAIFTRNSGDPATGLALADIDLYLTSRRRTDGVLTIIWDGTQNPTGEITNIGAYVRGYATENLSIYDYFARAYYTGAVVLDVDHVTGTEGLVVCEAGAGAVQHTVIIIDQDSNPIADADVWISSDVDGSTVVADGQSDSNGKFYFWGDTGVSYWVWAQKDGVNFTNPREFVVP